MVAGGRQQRRERFGILAVTSSNWQRSRKKDQLTGDPSHVFCPVPGGDRRRKPTVRLCVPSAIGHAEIDRTWCCFSGGKTGAAPSATSAVWWVSRFVGETMNWLGRQSPEEPSDRARSRGDPRQFGVLGSLFQTIRELGEFNRSNVIIHYSLYSSSP